jgi:hypothetical protein
MIRLLGSADGYNTEASERLHIDYTKDAYRATNRKDYLKQMTSWLRQQELADQFSAYLDWRLQRGTSARREPDDENCELEDEDVVEVEVGVQAIDVMPSVAAVDGNVSSSCPPKSTTTLTYRIAKSPSICNVSVNDIINQYHAGQFLPALTTYIKSTSPSFTNALSASINQFDLYKQVSIAIGYLPGIAQGVEDKVRATAAPASHGTSSSGVAHSDTALVTYTGNPESRYTKGTVLEGLRVAQVRVIFDLPHHIIRGPSSSEPGPSPPIRLAYIEWFKPFAQPEQLTGMYILSRATRDGLPMAEVVPLDRLVGSAHLVPRFGTDVDKRWRHETVLEQSKSFYLNKWITFHTFYQLQYSCTST